MSLLFILLLAFSVAALAVTKSQQEELIKKAWVSVEPEQVQQIEKRFGCCGLNTVQASVDKCKKDDPGKVCCEERGAIFNTQHPTPNTC